MDDLETFCISYGLSSDTIAILHQNGVHSLLALTSLLPGDLESLGLRLGQLRLIQSALKGARGTDEASSVEPLPSPTGPGAATREVPLDTKVAHRQLGINTGECSYLKIKDYVTPLKASTNEDSSIVLPDGSRFVPKGQSASGSVKLDSVTALQFMEANARILGNLITQNKVTSLDQVLQYLGYTAMVARLGQRKTWQSLLAFDNSYREAQSLEGFSWGTDLRDLRDQHLADRPSGSSNDSQGSAHAGNKSGPNSKTKKESGPTPKVKFCRDFNYQTCTRSPCPYKHICISCSADHPIKQHPQ